MIDASGYGARIREALLRFQSDVLKRRYSDAEFGRDVGLIERDKPYGRASVADWIAERSEPARSTFLAMEAVLKRPGIAIWLSFNTWPRLTYTAGAAPSDDRPDYLKVAERQGGQVVSSRSDAAFRPEKEKPAHPKRAAGGTRKPKSR